MIPFENVFTYDNLYKSYLKCLKGIKWKQSTQNYISNSIINIQKILREIYTNTYKSQKYIIFPLAYRGKLRECQSIHIYDRVLQKCLCDYCLIPLISPKLIYTNSACLKNKGAEFARKMFKKHLRKSGYNGYCLQIDFKSYFDNINHAKLIEKLKRLELDEKILNIIRYLLKLYDKDNKGKGLALGSQMSQSFALYYASEIDNYVYHYKNIKLYGRYMDDIYAFSNSKNKLKKLLINITKIASKSDIIINVKKTHIIPNRKGLKFLKTRFILLPSGKILQKLDKRLFYRMKKKIKKNVISENDFKSWYNSYKKYDCKLKLMEVNNVFKKSKRLFRK